MDETAARTEVLRRCRAVETRVLTLRIGPADAPCCVVDQTRWVPKTLLTGKTWTEVLAAWDARPTL